MGFTVTRTLFPLDFKGTQYEGMEVTMKRPSLKATGDMSGLFGINVKNMTEEDVKRVARVVDHFAACLHTWNLDEDVINPETNEPTGEKRPIPPTVEGVSMVEDYVILDIVHVWLATLMGEGILTADIPQETLTPQQT